MSPRNRFSPQTQSARRATIALVAALAAACSAQIPTKLSPAVPAGKDGKPIRPVQSAPMRDPSALTSVAANAHLTYYGGRVIANVEVHSVNWGASVNPELSGGSNAHPNGLAAFYGAVTNSTYMDWLNEYDTAGLNGQDGQPGSNQRIGRGTFGSSVTINPSATGSSITDAQIQSELAAQIASGALPQPTTDAGGNVNSIYLINFPQGISITQGGSSSCVQFCAYHGTTVIGGRSVYYGVLPDVYPGSACNSGCGNDPDAFNNSTSVASHELIEAVTDGEVGLGTTVTRPLAWYDSANGEIGDICNASQARVAGFVVQTEWSNLQGACVSSGPNAPPPPPVANDFALALSPSSATIAAGQSGSLTVSTSVVSGSAQTLTLAVSGLPAGTSGSFSPASVSAGQGATLTLSVSSSAGSSSGSFTVSGSAASGSHGATGSLTVQGNTPPPPPPQGGALTNGDFETGDLSGWTASGTAAVGADAHTGSFAAQLGDGSPSADSSIAQTFNLPANSAQLSLWYKISCPDTVTYDWASASLLDNSTGQTTTILANACTNTGTWANALVDISAAAGHSVTLTLANHDDNYPGDPTFTLFDDVTIVAATAPPPLPPSGNLIANGGFEGSLSGWSLGGQKLPVDSVVEHHTGVNSLRVGSSNGTGTDLSGDSWATQNVTIPASAKKATLTFWYYAATSDSIAYDWQDAQVRSAGGTQLIGIFHLCSNAQVWTKKTVDLTSLKGQTVQLYFNGHDDGYGGDPTSLWIDDVSVTVQ